MWKRFAVWRRTHYIRHLASQYAKLSPDEARLFRNAVYLETGLRNLASSQESAERSEVFRILDEDADKS